METNNLGRAGASFVRACKKIKWDGDDTVQIVSLDPIIRSLKHLHPLDGYVYETYLPQSIGFSDCCTPYVRESTLPNLDKSAIVFDPKTHSERLPSGYYRVWEKIGYEFTEECIWELFLLTDLVCHLPKFWHGNYAAVTYFLQTGGLDNIIKCAEREDYPERILGFKYKNGYSKLCKLNQDASLLPQVTLLSESEASIHFAAWNDWSGLMEVTVKVTRSNNTVSFGKKQLKDLVKYHCGLVF